ncbi:glycosyltransferase [Oleiphilus sp. HI0067]|nr:glycosyltransferase [Oleiphilus sp. HI0067]
MPHPVKLLYIIDSFTSPYAGTEGQLYKLIEGLDRDQFQPHLILFNCSQYIEQNGFPCGVSVLGYSKLSSLNTWWELFKLLRKKKIDGYQLAHIFFNDPSIIAPPLLKLLGIKSIISRRDMGYWYTPSYLKALRFNAKLVDAAIVNSRAVKEITCEKEGYKPANVHVVYNGYQDIEILAANKIDLRQSDDEIVLGIVANIRPIKRMQDAINAVAQLTCKGFKLRLVIVGGGDPSDLKALADNLNVLDRVEFVGSQSKASDYIQGFDICLLCSESEGFSNAIVEYMQHSKPVVCSAVGGNPECVDDGKTGFLYEAGDVSELTEIINALVEAKDAAETRAAFGREAQRKVAENLTLPVMLAHQEELYINVLNER